MPRIRHRPGAARLEARMRFRVLRAASVAPIFVLSLVIVGALAACSKSNPGPVTRPSTVTHHPFLILLCKTTDIADVPHDREFYKGLLLDLLPGKENVHRFFLDQSYGAADLEGSVLKDWLPTTRSTADLKGDARPDGAQPLARGARPGMCRRLPEGHRPGPAHHHGRHPRGGRGHDLEPRRHRRR
jgi:hypothetical protein